MIAYKPSWRCVQNRPVYSGRKSPGKTHHHHDFSKGTWHICQAPLTIEATENGGKA